MNQKDLDELGEGAYITNVPKNRIQTQKQYEEMRSRLMIIFDEIASKKLKSKFK